jgi:hypothetical protein
MFLRNPPGNNQCGAKIVKILYSVKGGHYLKFSLKNFYGWTSNVLAKSSKTSQGIFYLKF